MADNITREQRVRCMSRNKSNNTGPELRLRKAAWAAGLRYRLGYRLLGKPDLVFISPRLAVFLDGCFWHGCPQHCIRPKSNESYWHRKISRNFERDQRYTEELREQGWTVLRIWEHELAQDTPTVVSRIISTLDCLRREKLAARTKPA